MAQREQVYEGIERRSGLERRLEAPGTRGTGPRLIGSVAVVGHGVFGPGQEKQFADAVAEANKASKVAGGKPLIDLEVLERAGAIAGFAQVTAAELQATRNHQTERGSREPVEVQHDRGAVAYPGRPPFEQIAPLPPAPAAVEPVTRSASRPAGGEPKPVRKGGGGARTGGAGRTAPKAAREK